MKNLFRLLLVTICVSVFSVQLFAQPVGVFPDELEPDTTNLTKVKCLSEHSQFISLNVLQFAIGTANINYEIKIRPQFAVQVALGTVLGSRILFRESTQTCQVGGHYVMFQPRFYMPKSSKNCYAQFGFAASFKYWDYKGEMDVTERESANYKADKVAYPDKNDFNQKSKYANESNYLVLNDGEKIYSTKEPCTEHLAGISIFGKGAIAGGFTGELEVGVAAGARNGKLCFSPNFGIQFGWTFGKINPKSDSNGK